MQGDAAFRMTALHFSSFVMDLKRDKSRNKSLEKKRTFTWWGFMYLGGDGNNETCTAQKEVAQNGRETKEWREMRSTGFPFSRYMTFLTLTDYHLSF